MIASFVLFVEKLALLADPPEVPSCSINLVLSCGSVRSTEQSSAFGFPNAVLGVAGFSALLTSGVVLLTRAELPRWFWWGMQLGATAEVLFVHWLIVQSLYRIGALCPYCMAVWVAAITAFTVTTSTDVARGLIPASERIRAMTAYAPTVVIGWVVIITALATVRFESYRGHQPKTPADLQKCSQRAFSRRTSCDKRAIGPLRP